MYTDIGVVDIDMYLYTIYVLILHTSILASSHPHILIFVCTCLYPHILTSSYSQVNLPFLTSRHPDILRFLCVSLQPCILTLPYPMAYVLRVLVCVLTFAYPKAHVLWVLVGILASSHPHTIRFQCPHLPSHILISSVLGVVVGIFQSSLPPSYPQFHAYLFASLHLHILISSGS